MNINRQPIIEHAEEAMRRISNCSSKFDSADSIIGELDLRQDYDNAINCLIQCETIIKNLQDQLVKKEEQLANANAVQDTEAEAKYLKPQEELSVKATMQVMQEEMASKDDRIVNLEEKLVHMSLELASTKAHEDELQHQLKIVKSVASSFDNNNVSSSNSNYKPCSKNRRHTTTASALGGQQRSSWRSTDDTTTMEVTHGSKMSLSSVVSNTVVTPSTPLDESNNSSSSRLSNFGQFFTSMRSSRGEMQVMFPSQLGLGEEKKAGRPAMHSVNEASTQHALPRRTPNANRMMHRKSSRSFLEAKGVVFPVSSFEVLSKGCLPPSLSKSGLSDNMNGSKCGANEEWGVLNEDILLES